jgi:hypothetical protein
MTNSTKAKAMKIIPISSISNEVRTRLKELCTESVPRPCSWDWDRGTWRWELSLRDSSEDVDAGYVAIEPLKNGKAFKYGTLPEPEHDEWAFIFVPDFAEDFFLVRGTIQQVKQCLDGLLLAHTPEIPKSYDLAKRQISLRNVARGQS